MNFLKRLRVMFSPPSNDPGLYFYIRCTKCGEVIRVRVSPTSEISVTDEGTYFARKGIMGRRCRNKIEATFNFSAGTNRKLTTTEITGGELVNKKAYEEYEAEQEDQQPSE